MCNIITMKLNRVYYYIRVYRKKNVLYLNYKMCNIYRGIFIMLTHIL